MRLDMSHDDLQTISCHDIIGNADRQFMCFVCAAMSEHVKKLAIIHVAHSFGRWLKYRIK